MQEPGASGKAPNHEWRSGWVFLPSQALRMRVGQVDRKLDWMEQVDDDWRAGVL
jgi:hypothetical protein